MKSLEKAGVLVKGKIFIFECCVTSLKHFLYNEEEVT